MALLWQIPPCALNADVIMPNSSAVESCVNRSRSLEQEVGPVEKMNWSHKPGNPPRFGSQR